MIPQTIRVFPLSKTKEPKEFGTIEKVYNFFLKELPSRTPSGKFYIPTEKSHFEKNSLILFQYAEKKNEEKIIGHSILLSDGCVLDNGCPGYIGYYRLDIKSCIIYKMPVTKKEIHKIWNKKLFQAKLKLDISKYDEYMKLLKHKGNIKKIGPHFN